MSTKKKAAPKKSTRGAAAKKTAKKAAPKKSAKKSPPKATKKSAVKKAPKKASKKSTKKAAAKKSTKKAAAKKSTKKAAAKKSTKKAAAKKAAPKAATKKTKKAAPKKAAKKSAPKPKREPAGGAAVEARAILESETRTAQLAELGLTMMEGGATNATHAARVVSEIANAEVQLVVPLVDKLARGLSSRHRRVVQTAAEALPRIARVAPARVARQLDILRGSFDDGTLVAKDGLVRTFAALCTASVAYQKRLEPVLVQALGEADGKLLLQWTQVVLPALKGEPHANARAVVEERLDRIPRHIAQEIAEILKIKLRIRYR